LVIEGSVVNTCIQIDAQGHCFLSPIKMIMIRSRKVKVDPIVLYSQLDQISIQ
jgi:hypothetical protein